MSEETNQLWIDLGFDPDEAAMLEVKADLFSLLQDFVHGNPEKLGSLPTSWVPLIIKGEMSKFNIDEILRGIHMLGGELLEIIKINGE